MAASAQTASDIALQDLLKRLHDDPVNSDGAQEAELETIYSHLSRATNGKSTIHWFCKCADSNTVESATFLLRLYAYNSPKVEQWKTWFNSCLRGCVDCVLGFERAKICSRNTYFGAFSEDVKDAFWSSFSAWELENILAQLTNASSSKSLSDVSVTTVYRMICNFQVFQDPRVQSLLTQDPNHLPSDWPSDPPLPAMLVLLIHENAAVREWAAKQTSKCKTVPISQADASSLAYPKALEIIISPFVSPQLESSPKSIPSATDSETLWSSFHSVIRLLHPSHLTYLIPRGVDIRHVVAGHLHDHGPEFGTILRCFNLILKRLGNSLWLGEGPEYPQVVFDAFKDNPSWSSLLLEKNLSAERNPWFFKWLPEFLLTVRDQPAYPEVLAKMADFMCEELQHERFADARPVVMACAARLLKGQIRDGNSATTNVLDIHAEILVTVSFARSHQKPEWQAARIATRDLIQLCLVQDLRNIGDAITRCCTVLALCAKKPDKAKPKPRVHDNGRDSMGTLVIRDQIWKKMYQNLQPGDTEGLAVFLSIIARAAHNDAILKNSFTPALEFSGLGSLIDVVNLSLDIVKGGFSELTSRYEMSTAALRISQHPGVAKELMKLMLSPAADLHNGAMNIVSSAFDVDGRRDCFEVLFEKFPEQAFAGTFELLTAFNEYAPVVPEACSLSKSLVRCSTDIIGILCSTPKGLFHRPEYLRSSDENGPASRVPQLWTLMCKAITVIFKRTPSWSQYYKNEEMTDWMRDALIFGREILAERPVFEAAAKAKQSSNGSGSSVRSGIAKRMLLDLQDILVELTRWLRLTDEELLHQSCTIIHSLLELFRETSYPPPEAVLQKLTKQVSDVRNRDLSTTKSRLDPAKLAPLEAMLSSFDDKDDDDDEIEFIETKHVMPPPKGIDKAPKTKLDSKAGSKQVWNLASAAPSTSRKKSTFLSSADQEMLDAAASMPKFRKSTVASSSKSTSNLPPPSYKTAGATKVQKVQESDSSSSSDESGDDESQRTTLANMSKLQKSPKIRKPTERRQVKMLDLPHLKQNAQEARLSRRDEARVKALRFKPDISPLHKTLLSWDYQHDGATPPKAKLPLYNVPDTFSDFRHYRAVFEPLLLMECWAQLMQSKEESFESYDCKIVSRQYNGIWSDLDLLFTTTLRREWFLTENDVVLLRNPGRKAAILAKAKSFKNAGRDQAEAGVRCYLQNDARDPGLQLNSTWTISKVFSLSTLHREYAALAAAEYYDFADWILRPSLSRPPNVDGIEIRQAMETYKVNEPQARAILSALRTDGFVLIQGPPGTGKTSTICALISASLKAKPQTSLKNVDRPKILLCAPSNAAIDEIVHRLKSYPTLKVVRTGAAQAIGLNVKDVSLDSLIEQKLGTDGDKGTQDTSNELLSGRQELNSVKQLIDEKRRQLGELHDNAARTATLENELRQLQQKRSVLMQRIDQLRDKRTQQVRSMDTARRRARDEVLREADVICSTLSGTGHENLEQYEFEMVIIDEAAQAIELSSLIPLKYRCTRCVMVGDPQQLPPTVISMEASKYHYNQSLFVRLQKQYPDAVHLLSIQYRMHPDISQLPSKVFYDNRLQDGPKMDEKTLQPWHTHSKFGTYRFFNVGQGFEESSGRSTKNKAECQVAVALFNRLRRDHSSVDFDFRVGIVSMYSAQIKELKTAFEQRFGRDVLHQVDFRTVDGFQGQEKDVIILSCVRAGPGVVNIGHVKDVRRMNVAITRAKSSLFILGNAATLERGNDTWRTIVADSKSRNFFTDVDVQYFTARAHSATSSTPSRAPVRKSKQIKLPQTTTTPAIPPDLSTPKELKASLSAPKTNPSETMGPVATTSDTSTDRQMGKRKQEAVLDDPPPPERESFPSNPKPNPPKKDADVPPRKRPKTAQTMFIPKNKNKRPAEDSASNRQRL